MSCNTSTVTRKQMRKVALSRARAEFDSQPNAQQVREWVHGRLADKKKLNTLIVFLSEMTVGDLIVRRVGRFGGRVEPDLWAVLVERRKGCLNSTKYQKKGG